MSTLLLKGSPIGKIKGILLDKDGTLSNSENHLITLGSLRLSQAINLFESNKRENNKATFKLKQLLSITYGLTPEGLHPNSTLAVASREDNLISTASIFCLLGEGWPNAIALATEIFHQADEIYSETQKGMVQCPLLPGFLSFFRELKNAGITCALISNDNNKGIESFLQKNNLAQEITYYWSCESKPSKPNPGAVYELCKIIKLEPKDCALIGDANSDLLMAQKAGVKLALGYTGGWQIPPSLKYQHHLVQHWDELSIA
tara:strand:+ start:495 stop:1274 length:780 start_codon:yes stop_codon:yes gene_type:complete